MFSTISLLYNRLGGVGQLLFFWFVYSFLGFVFAVGRGHFFLEKKKGRERGLTHNPRPLPLALALRSEVAPQRCFLSYADTKLELFTGTRK